MCWICLNAGRSYFYRTLESFSIVLWFLVHGPQQLHHLLCIHKNVLHKALSVSHVIKIVTRECKFLLKDSHSWSQAETMLLFISFKNALLMLKVDFRTTLPGFVSLVMSGTSTMWPNLYLYGKKKEYSFLSGKWSNMWFLFDCFKFCKVWSSWCPQAVAIIVDMINKVQYGPRRRIFL